MTLPFAQYVPTTYVYIYRAKVESDVEIAKITYDDDILDCWEGVSNVKNFLIFSFLAKIVPLEFET